MIEEPLAWRFSRAGIKTKTEELWKTGGKPEDIEAEK